MKHICVLLNGGIFNDSRVIKTITTMSGAAHVDLFYANNTPRDGELFNENVRLFPVKINYNSLWNKLLRNTLFYNQYLIFVKHALATGIRYDYIWANDLPCLKPGAIIKKKLGTKLVYDSHEIFIGTLNQFFPDTAGKLKKLLFRFFLSIMTRCGSRAERKYVRQADYFITTSHSFRNYLAEKYNRSDIRIVMNCPKSREIKKVNDFKTMLGLDPGTFVVLFQGMLNKGRALMELVDSMQFVKPHVRMVILGAGMLKNDMKKRAADKGLSDKIFFLDMVPMSELLNYTCSADVGVNLQAAINISKKLQSANKMFEYIHAGIPVIASDAPENTPIIEQFGIGIAVDNSPQSIATAINTISDKGKPAYTENCKKAAQVYNWENQESVILNTIV